MLKSRGIIVDHVNDDFEGALLLSLRGSVVRINTAFSHLHLLVPFTHSAKVTEALLNGVVDFTRQECDRLVEQRIDVSSNHGKLIQCLAQVPALMKRSKAALRFGESFILCIPELVLDTNILRARCSTIIAKFRHCLDLCNNDEGLLPIEVRNHMHARQLRMLGLAFATGIILNCIFTALDGPNLTIHHESSTFSNEIVKLAHLSLRYRPLGSMLFLSNLTFAWIGASGPDRRNEIQAMLGAYESVCLGRNFTDWDLLLEQRRKRFCLEEDTGPEGAKKGHLAFGQGSACGM